MPIYVFKCDACDVTQEHILKFDETPDACDEAQGGCGSDESKLEKQVTSCTTRFERSIGWDGWDRVGPGMVGRTVDASKHIDSVRDDGVAAVGSEQKNPGSRKAV